MIGNQINNQPSTINEFSLPENHTVKRILVFVKDTLPEFEFLLKQSNIEIHREDDISKELSRFFNDKARAQNLFFQFNEKKGVDFTIFVNPYKMGVSSIFMIEAKRLSKKHRDYVTGKTGGIERIKREQEDFGVHLNHGAMIGYIQDENQDYWENKINTWIDNLIEEETDNFWGEEDKLMRNTNVSNYTSKHIRVSQKPIILYHFWISLN